MPGVLGVFKRRRHGPKLQCDGNLLEATYTVTDQHAFGDGYLIGIDYRDATQPGNLDFFLKTATVAAVEQNAAT